MENTQALKPPAIEDEDLLNAVPLGISCDDDEAIEEATRRVAELKADPKKYGVTFDELKAALKQ